MFKGLMSADNNNTARQSIENKINNLLTNSNSLSEQDSLLLKRIQEQLATKFFLTDRDANALQKSIYKDIIGLQIANLVMIRNTETIFSYSRLKSQTSYIPYLIFAASLYFAISDDSSPTIKTASNYIACMMLLYTLGDELLTSTICKNVLKMTERILESYFRDIKTKELFPQKNNKLLLFSDTKFNHSISYEPASKSFYVSESKMLNNINIIFPNSLPPHLKYLYSPPTSSNFGGMLGNFKYLVDGETNFSGNIVFFGGEILIATDYPESMINKLFYNILNSLLCDLFDNHKKNIELIKQHRELKVLESCYFATVLAFNDFTSYSYTEAVDTNTFRHNIKDISEFMFSKRGVCRHQSLLLAKLLQYATELGLLHGQTRFRATREVSTPPLYLRGIGHAWLEYHNREWINGYYLLDPVNHIFALRNEIKNAELNSSIEQIESNPPHEMLNDDNYEEMLHKRQRSRCIIS